MSLAARRRLLVAFLALFAAWPPLHFLLVQRYEINPWKFAGWAMYARPPARVSVSLAGEGPSGPVAVRPVPRGELEEFRLARVHFGRMARPDRLALALFRRDPRLRRLAVRVTALHLVAGADRLRSSRQLFDYRRVGRGAVRDGEGERR